MRRPVKQLGKWQLVYGTDALFEYDRTFGWRRSNFGFFKLTELPPEGAQARSANYIGFWLRWRWWFPLERDR